MGAITSTPIDVEAKGAITSGRLFFLDLSGCRIMSANPDGSDLRTTARQCARIHDAAYSSVSKPALDQWRPWQSGRFLAD